MDGGPLRWRFLFLTPSTEKKFPGASGSSLVINSSDSATISLTSVSIAIPIQLGKVYMRVRIASHRTQKLRILGFADGFVAILIDQFDHITTRLHKPR